MKNLLFVSYPLESLLIPTFGLANILSKEYTINYAASSRFENLVKAQKFNYYDLNALPFGYGHERLSNQARNSTSLYFDCVSDRMTGRLYYERANRLNVILSEVKPKLIIIDLLCSSDFIILYKNLVENKATIVIINTMMSTRLTYKIPHIGSSLHPRQKSKILLEYFFAIGRQSLKDISDFIIHGGYSSKRLLLNKIKENQIPKKYSLINNRTVSYFFNNIPEIIAAPREFEFTNMPSDSNQYYIGPLINADRIELNKTKEFESILSQMETFKKVDKENRLIYCAFGSMHGEWNNIIEKFLERLFEVVSKIQNVMMICAFDNGKDLRASINVSSNILLFKRVPQLKCLQLADLFITHGGLGSVKESIMSGVPMLSYPITKKWDTAGNSCKIAFHGLGLTGNIKKDSSQLIYSKILQILQDPIYYENVAKFKDMITRKYNSESILGLFERIIESNCLGNSN